MSEFYPHSPALVQSAIPFKGKSDLSSKGVLWLWGRVLLLGVGPTQQLLPKTCRSPMEAVQLEPIDCLTAKIKI